jgi:hypothetical protein
VMGTSGGFPLSIVVWHGLALVDVFLDVFVHVWPPEVLS